MNRLSILTLLVASAMFTSGVAAQDQNSSLHACKGEAQTLCPGVKPGGGRLVDCLNAVKEQVSPACRAALPLMKQCSQEMTALCDPQANAKPIELARCAIAKESQFSRACQGAITMR